MYLAERQAEISRLTQELERVSVQELAARFAVTPETIRKDLSELEVHGLIKRTHGGAVRVERLSYSTPVTERTELRHEEKRAMARAAIPMLRPDATVGIDAGTSTIELAQAIPRDLPLTVVTYSILVAGALVDLPQVSVYLLGGLLRPNSRGAVGTWAQRQLSDVTLDIAFLSVDGISVQQGLTTHNLEEAQIKQKMAHAARRVVVLADSSKFGKEEFSRVLPCQRVDDIITDWRLNPEWKFSLRDCDVRLIISESPEALSSGDDPDRR